MALTPNDVLNKQFQTTKFRDGYDQDEVDDFLDEVLAEFQRLIAENEQLKAQLASAPAAAPAADSAETESLRRQLEAAQAQVAQLGQQLADTQQQLQNAQNGTGAFDGMNSAEYLQLARRVHEEHVREGVAKRDQAIAEGEAKAAQLVADAQAQVDRIVGEAQEQASQVTGEARSKADTLVAEAQARAEALVNEAQTARDTQMGTLAEEVARLQGDRDALQQRVDELQEFERNYRASLRSYLESQLAELQSSSGETPPADAATAQAAGTPESSGASYDLPPTSPFEAQDSLDVPAEVPASFEVPPVVDDVPQSAWTGTAEETTTDFGTFGDTSSGAVTYEIPGYEPEGGEQPPQSPYPGFGGN